MRRKGQQISKEIAMLGMKRVTFRGLRLTSRWTAEGGYYFRRGLAWMEREGKG